MGLVFIILAIVFFGVLGLLFGSQTGVRWFYPVLPVLPGGLGQSLNVALAGNKHPPKILVFQDPNPQVLAIRSMGRPGTLLLSQGVLCQYREAELQKLLKASIESLRGGKSVAETAFWFLSLCISKCLPGRSTNGAPRLGVFSVVSYWMIYPNLAWVIARGRGRIFPRENGSTVFL